MLYQDNIFYQISLNILITCLLDNADMAGSRYLIVMGSMDGCHGCHTHFRVNVRGLKEKLRVRRISLGQKFLVCNSCSNGFCFYNNTIPKLTLSTIMLSAKISCVSDVVLDLPLQYKKNLNSPNLKPKCQFIGQKLLPTKIFRHFNFMLIFNPSDRNM